MSFLADEFNGIVSHVAGVFDDVATQPGAVIIEDGGSVRRASCGRCAR